MLKIFELRLDLLQEKLDEQLASAAQRLVSTADEVRVVRPAISIWELDHLEIACLEMRVRQVHGQPPVASAAQDSEQLRVKVGEVDDVLVAHEGRAG